jgi:nucleotide-binding universal stress UspA family protein
MGRIVPLNFCFVPSSSCTDAWWGVLIGIANAVFRSMKTQKSAAIWAIDPFLVEDVNSQKDVIDTLNALCSPEDEIQPVYVWGSEAVGDANTTSKVAEQANRFFQKTRRPKFLGRLLDLRVVRARSGMVLGAETLVAHAKLMNAPFIVLNRHAQGAFKRWFQGSFCESISLTSSVPLLIVPPRGSAKNKTRGILFPTDFSSASIAAFESVMELAKRKKLPITIFHKVEFPVFVGSEFVSTAATGLVRPDREQIAEMRVEAEKLAERARGQGLKVETLVEGRRGTAPGPRILTIAKRGYAVLAMAAHQTFFERLLMGSVSRFVQRAAPCPVLILRPEPPSKNKKAGPSALRGSVKKEDSVRGDSHTH